MGIVILVLKKKIVYIKSEVCVCEGGGGRGAGGDNWKIKKREKCHSCT